MIDGLAFFEKELEKWRYPYYLKGRWKQRIASRLLGFTGWLEGKVSFKDAVLNIMPSRWKGVDVSARVMRYSEHSLDKIFSNTGIYQDGKVGIFGNPLYPMPSDNLCARWIATFTTLNETIMTDQYHANDFLKEDSVVIDCGAYLGTFSILAAHLSPNGRIFTFEPTLGMQEILRRNTAPYPQIEVIQSGVGDKSGRKVFMASARAPAVNTFEDSVLMQEHSDYRKHFTERVEVPMVTIDDFVRERNLDRVDFIKMDTEGYEKQIIEGARETIKRFSPTLSLSAYHSSTDKTEVPKLVRTIDSMYQYKSVAEAEPDLIFWK